MSIRFEYTKSVGPDSISPDVDEMRRLVKNILRENLTFKEGELVERLEQDPQTVLILEEQVLLEMAILRSKRWPREKKELRVFFMDENKIKQDLVMKYASEWNIHSGLKVVRTNDIGVSEVRVSFDEPQSWSVLGTDEKHLKRKPTMNIGWLDSSVNEQEHRRIVLHEFGHAFGLIHEHQRWDAEIPWNRQVVTDYCKKSPMNWTDEKIERNIFQVFKEPSTNESPGGVDTLSIMVYNIPDEFTDGKVTFPMNYDLSDTDMEFIGKIYPEEGIIKS